MGECFMLCGSAALVVFAFVSPLGNCLPVGDCSVRLQILSPPFLRVFWFSHALSAALSSPFGTMGSCTRCTRCPRPYSPARSLSEPQIVLLPVGELIFIWLGNILRRYWRWAFGRRCRSLSLWENLSSSPCGRYASGSWPLNACCTRCPRL
jgi:hypothetical protein